MGLTLLTLDCSTSTSARAAQCPPCRQPDPDELQRITESIWWYRDEGNHSAEALRLGKQTLCQLSYSRSGGRAGAPRRESTTTARRRTRGRPKGEPMKVARGVLQ